MHSHLSDLWIIVTKTWILLYTAFYHIWTLSEISNFQFKPQLVNCPICLWHFYFIFKLQILRHKFYTYPISATISFSNIKYEIYQMSGFSYHVLRMLSLFSNLLVTFLSYYLIHCTYQILKCNWLWWLTCLKSSFFIRMYVVNVVQKLRRVGGNMFL